MHRVGRTGRFGTQGAAVSVVTRSELGRLKGVVSRTHSDELQPLLSLPSNRRLSRSGGEGQPASMSHDEVASAEKAEAVGEEEEAEEMRSGLERGQGGESGEAYWQRAEVQAAYSFWWWRLAAWRRTASRTSWPWYVSHAEEAPWLPFPVLAV